MLCLRTSQDRYCHPGSKGEWANTPGVTVPAAAFAAGVTRQTLVRWRQSPAFAAVLGMAAADVAELHQRQLAAAAGQAIDVPIAVLGGVESTASMASSIQAAPRRNCEATRLGANPPAGLVTLEEEAAMEVYAACGVPVPLAIGSQMDGTAQREAWCRFVMGSVELLARVWAVELARKLDAPGPALTFRELWAHVQAGRAAAFAKLVAGGIALADAAAASEVLSET